MPMAGKIHTRRATPSDLGFIVESNVSMAMESEGLLLDESKVRPGVSAVLANEALGFYVVAEVDGNLAGQLMVTFEWSDWRNGLFWWIQSVYVGAEYRRRGVYRAMHNHVAEAAQAAGGVCGLRLYVEQENAVAQQVYESLDMYRTRYQMYEVEF